MLLDILFPEKCIYCNKYGKIICDNCLKKIKNNSVLKKVDNDYFDYIFFNSFYTGITKQQLHNFKFHDKSFYSKYFIELSLRNKLIYTFLKKFDIITYIPMSYKKQLKRGYNQSELLAKELSKKLEIKFVKVLDKPEELKTQSTLSEKEREENIKNAFKYINNINLSNQNIILVDDILTTGATVREASRILKINKVNEICIFTIAKTQINKYKKL